MYVYIYTYMPIYVMLDVWVCPTYCILDYQKKYPPLGIAGVPHVQTQIHSLVKSITCTQCLIVESYPILSFIYNYNCIYDYNVYVTHTHIYIYIHNVCVFYHHRSSTPPSKSSGRLRHPNEASLTAPPGWSTRGAAPPCGKFGKRFRRWIGQGEIYGKSIGNQLAFDGFCAVHVSFSNICFRS